MDTSSTVGLNDILKEIEPVSSIYGIKKSFLQNLENMIKNKITEMTGGFHSLDSLCSRYEIPDETIMEYYLWKIHEI